MANRIAYNDVDGYTHIVLPAYDDRLRDPAKSDDDLIDDCIMALPPGTTYIVIDDQDAATVAVMLQRDKRDEWAIVDGKLVIPTYR